MIKLSLEKFDSPIVIINHVHKNEDWGVVAAYVATQNTEESEGVRSLARVGWHVSVTLPNLDDMDFDRVFDTPEDALEFGINQIVSENFALATSSDDGLEYEVYPFGRYKSIA